MHLLCQFERHHASTCEVWNDGHFFSFCERCGSDLVRRPTRRWRAVRAPNKVVWKPRQPFDMPWRPESLPLEPAAGIPIAAEWRAMIERSRRAAEQAPARPLRWADEFTAAPAPDVTPVGLAAG